ncbi:MAG: GNAT family N-acetyltransferase [Chitinophagaceae bacterium]
MLREPDYILPGVEGFKGELLDGYLAAGYYRMQHMVFTTHHTRLELDTVSVPVFWLRTILAKIDEQKSALVIRKKCAAFTVRYKRATVTPETETLYALYRNHVAFSTAETSSNYLHQYGLENPFDSWMVEVRDTKKLVAVGYFDRGGDAITGILNFYDPSYTKYSLGKFMILKKIDYAQQHKMTYYYTGYISTGSNRFDYKLFPSPDAVEVYLPVEDIWVPFSFFGKQQLQEYFLDQLD